LLRRIHAVERVGRAVRSANTGVVLVPVFSKNLSVPSAAPSSASRSPSPSTSAKLGLAWPPMSTPSNGLARAGALDVGRRRVGAGVLEEPECAVAKAHDRIEVAVAIQVGKARRACGTDAVERIGCAGGPYKRGRRARAGVLAVN
jgi:hypothetical protein